MKTLIRLFLGLIFIIPALWLGYFTINHIRLLYFQSAQPHSFGLNLQFGPITIRDPWSDAIALFSVALLMTAGLLAIKDSKEKVPIMAVAILTLGMFILGLLPAA